MKNILLITLSILSLPMPAFAEASPGVPKPPVVRKLGTVDSNLCETTPFVFKDKLYRLEWHRKARRLRIMDHDKQEEVSHFGERHRFPCAFVEGDKVYVIGTKETASWTGNTLTMFTSTDLKNWEERVIFVHPQGKNFCNTTLCKADGRYVMSYELNEHGFHAQFLESKDLITWTMLPDQKRHLLPRYCAPHCLRYHDGWFYLFYLEAGKPRGYEQYITRSKDLEHWEYSPLNPVLAPSPEDRNVLNPALSAEVREKIAKAQDTNNSDIDFCDYQGKLVISYSWGNQNGTEFIAEAEYAGTTSQFLQAWFPDLKEWKGIDLTRPLSTFAKDRAKYGGVLSADAKATLSSGRQDGTLLTGTCKAPFAFHTNSETKPWIAIDLGKKSTITGVLIRNRTDGFLDRSEGLRLLVSDDGKDWREVWRAEKPASEWEVLLSEKDIAARHVRLETSPGKAAAFHLQHVEVWGK